VPVRDEIGQYGGTWRRGYRGVSDMQGPVKLIYAFGLHFNISDDLETTEIVPGLYDEWTQNDDASEFTFHIRDGLKWSDGELFTTTDVQFWYDWYHNGNLGATRNLLNIAGEPMELEIVDSNTFTVRFAAPNPLLPFKIARDDTEGQHGGPTMGAPAHYLSQYIPDLGDQALIDAAIEEHGVSSWEELFGDGGTPRGPIAWWASNPDVPVMTAWRIVAPLPFSEPIVMERNPYFYCVDEEGQQLPYIDRIEHRLFDDGNVFDLWVSQGLIDMHERHVAAANFTFYKENEGVGDYRVFLWKGASTSAYHPNTSHDDPVLRDLFSDARFRHALSIAINRTEINDLIYNGLLEPRQASPVTGSPEFDPEFETRWTEYDPEGAIALLDEIGLPVGDDGMRQRPDGSPLAITLMHSQQGNQAASDEISLVVGYWNTIGLGVSEDPVERSLYEERVENNQVDIGYWGMDRSLLIQADATAYIGGSGQQVYAKRYQQWYEGNEAGIEPPEGHPLRRIRELWGQASTEPDAEKRQALMAELISVHKEAPLAIGTVGEPPAPVIVANRMHNVPDGIVSDTSLRNVRVANPEQFFMVE
jgi:peptide/nickel transport system substrate-binding protein